MAISNINYSNTFGQWLISTNQTITEVNSLKTDNYTKTSGTLYLDSSSIGLSVSNNSLFSGNTTFSGGTAKNLSIYVPSYFYQPITITSNTGIIAKNINLTATTGTAPLTVSSNTAVTNLNSDLLDGYHVGTSGSAIPALNAINTWGTVQNFGSDVNILGNVTITGNTILSGTTITDSGDYTLRANTGSNTSPNSTFTVKRNFTPSPNANNASIKWDNTALKWQINDVTNNNFYDVLIDKPTQIVTGAWTFGSNVIVTGDLTVNGNTTTVNSTTVSVDDKNIELGSVAVPTNTTADGGGITLKGTTDKTITWDNANANWTSSENWNLVTGKDYKINNVSVLNANTLGSSVVNSSLTSVGTIATGIWNAGAVTSSGIITGTRFVSNITTGTAPLTVTSNTLVANLNSELLAGNNSSYYANATNLSSGTVPTARLGSGTANTTTVLYGDNSWKTITSGATISNDNTTNSNYYPLWATANTGAPATIYTSSQKYYFNPSTGTLNATIFNSLASPGIAPLTITSNTLVANLNSELLAGNNSAYYTNATNLLSGTVPTARLGSGTANSTTVLYGDSTWKTVTSGATINNDIATNSNYYPLWATANTGAPATIYTSSQKYYFNPSTGTLNATIFNSLSDQSQKTDIKLIDNALNIINNIEGVEFTWKDTGKKSSGVIAQQLEEILPELVNTDIDSGLKSVNYSGIIGYLIQSVKELSEKVAKLERNV